MKKDWYKSRMVWLNLFTLVASILVFVKPDIAPIFDPAGAVVTGILAVLNTFLRFDTETAIG